MPKKHIQHKPDLTTLAVEPDGNGWYLDVNCSICGRSGSIGLLKISANGSAINLFDNDGVTHPFAAISWE